MVVCEEIVAKGMEVEMGKSGRERRMRRKLFGGSLAAAKREIRRLSALVFSDSFGGWREPLSKHKRRKELRGKSYKKSQQGNTEV